MQPVQSEKERRALDEVRNEVNRDWQLKPDGRLQFASDVCERLGLTYLVTGSTATIG